MKIILFLVLISGCSSDLKLRIRMQDSTIQQLSKKVDSLETIIDKR